MTFVPVTTPAPAPASFRLDAIKWFLTYPQCPLSKETVNDYLKTLTFPSHNIKDLMVCREPHEDGNYHLHALLILTRKFNCRNAHFFDIITEQGTYHPNIQSVRSLKAAITYLKKDGDFIASPGLELSSGGNLQDRWFEAISAATREEFLTYVQNNFSKEWVLWHDKILHYADRYYSKPVDPYMTPVSFEFHVPMILEQWVSENVLHL